MAHASNTIRIDTFYKWQCFAYSFIEDTRFNILTLANVVGNIEQNNTLALKSRAY
jgi:hypothetical protein